MTQTRWNKSRAADRLGLTRTQLYCRLRKHELKRPTASGPFARAMKAGDCLIRASIPTMG